MVPTENTVFQNNVSNYFKIIRKYYAQAYLKDGDSTSWKAHLTIATTETQA